MNFSIILASRERFNLLESLLASINSNTADHNNCEVICVIDEDDRVTRRYLDRLKSACSFVQFFVKKRANNLNDDYLNWAWKNYSRGDHIVIVNDDVKFQTKNWDQIAMAHLCNYLSDKPDGIAYGWLQDGLKSRVGDLNYCCFPLITRKAAEAVGFVMPPQFPGWGADVALFRIYAAINRVCDLSSVVVEHISYHNGVRKRDHININVEKKSIGSINPINQFDISPYVEKLLAKISSDPNFTGKITGAMITNATLTDVTIVGGRVVGGTVYGGKVQGGKLEGGLVTSGMVNGEFHSGFLTHGGTVNVEK